MRSTFIVRYFEFFCVIRDLHYILIFILYFILIYIMTEYHMHGLTFTKTHASKIVSAAKKHDSATIRLANNSLQGNHKLPLTQTQVTKVNKAEKLNKGINLKLSAAQLQHLEKTGGLLPLLALLPLIFGGLGAAGGLAGGAASAVSAANNAKAAAAAQAEMERHNREVEAQLKTGAGIVSDFVGKTPLNGSFLKPLLQKLGLGIKDCNKIMKGGCVCLRKAQGRTGMGLYMRPHGAGLYIGPEA